MTPSLPAGYRPLGRPGVWGFAWEGAAAWLERALARHGTLAAWAEAEGGVELARGRGTVHAVPAPTPGPDRSARWVVRRYRRGGWAAPLLDDRYVRSRVARPFREVEAHVEARARGVRTPAVVAGAAYEAGVVYRADLVTEEVAQAPSLADWLRAASGEVAEEDLMRRAGRAVRSLERARLVHADMSAGNILLERSGPAWIVDLDRCAVLPADAPMRGAIMRRRLERSLRKLGAMRGRALGASAWEALRAGYEEPS